MAHINNDSSTRHSRTRHANGLLFSLLALAGCAVPMEQPEFYGSESVSNEPTVDDGDSAASDNALYRLDEHGLPVVSGSLGTPTPPVPERPPEPSDDPEGYLDMYPLRFLLQAAGEQVISETNAAIREAGHGFTLRWKDNSLPLECGYDCARPPFMPYTRSNDYPNYWYAKFEAKPKFRLDMYPGIHRDIYVTVPFRVSCRGWEDDGVGEIAGYTGSTDIYMEGGGAFEAVLDFLFPGGLSRWIDGKVRAQLPGSTPGTRLPQVTGECTSLGVVQHYAQGAWQYDRIVWDVPQRGPFSIATLDTASFSYAR